MTQDPTTADVLDVESIGIRFGGLTALRDISFAVRAGEVVGLIGPNGAGKSTVLNCICGFYKPSTGTVRIDGEDVCGAVPHTLRGRGVVRTFQETLLIEDVPLIDNVMLAGTELRLREMLLSPFGTLRARRRYRDARDRAYALMEDYGLGAWAGATAASVPYGVRKLAEVARAQYAQPRLMLLDEPAAGLGPVDAEALADRLVELSAAGIAIVLIDHNMDFVARAARRVVVMSAGAVLAEGSPAQIRDDEAVVEAYLGAGGHRAGDR